LPDSQFHLVFCDVGQGDAVLVKYKNLQALIDGGPSGQSVSECLSKNIPPWDRELELLVLTHPDDDHLTGLIDVIKKYNVRQIVVNSLIKESGAFWQFRQEVLAESALIYSPQAGDQLKLGPLVINILWPKEKLGDDRVWQKNYLVSSETSQLTPEDSQILGVATVKQESNEVSIVMQLLFGDFQVLLPGDIGSGSENQIDFPNVEVLKIPHHGSRYSTSAELLQESSPELAIISVGKNSFGHPTDEVLEKLQASGIKTLRTDREGEIEIVSDGKKWGIKK